MRPVPSPKVLMPCSWEKPGREAPRGHSAKPKISPASGDGGLHALDVDDFFLHVISTDEAGLSKRHIHSSNYLETLDLIGAGFIGSAIFIARRNSTIFWKSACG